MNTPHSADDEKARRYQEWNDALTRMGLDNSSLRRGWDDPERYHLSVNDRLWRVAQGKDKVRNVGEKTIHRLRRALEEAGIPEPGRAAGGRRRIIQLLPADGWHALLGMIDIDIYCNEQRLVFNSVSLVPLIAWALVEKGDKRFVTGLILDENDFDIHTLRGPSKDGLIGYFREMPDQETIDEGLSFLQELNDKQSGNAPGLLR